MSTLFENHASSRLLFAMDALDTELIVDAGEGEAFPNPLGDDIFWITLDAGADGLEIVKCINRVQDTISIVRAQQGTTALAFAAGTLVDGRLTKTSLDNFIQKSGASMEGNIRLGGHSVSDGILENVTIRDAVLENFTTDIQLDLPAGLICMWSGADVDVPATWALCDGQNGTPDIRDKFIMAAGPTYPTNGEGGTEDYTSDECGPHDHAGVTEGHALTPGELPQVALDMSRELYDAGPGGPNPIPKQWRMTEYREHGYHLDTSPLGNDEAHDHALSADGVHQHLITGIRPPYYTLAYIIKL